MEEWTVEFLCTVDGIIAHCVLVAFVPFHPADLGRVPLISQLRLVAMCQKLINCM